MVLIYDMIETLFDDEHTFINYNVSNKPDTIQWLVVVTACHFLAASYPWNLKLVLHSLVNVSKLIGFWKLFSPVIMGVRTNRVYKLIGHLWYMVFLILCFYLIRRLRLWDVKKLLLISCITKCTSFHLQYVTFSSLYKLILIKLESLWQKREIFR